MTTAVNSVAATSQNAFNALVNSSQTATQTAEQNMANSVANGGVNSGSSAAGLTANFNTFIKILTTQLQNQDPTSPMDTNQFTQELVEFSGVEQQLNTNSLLQQLVNASGAGGVKALLGYVGQYVEVPSNGQLLIQGGQSDFSYTLPQEASATMITVKDSAGDTVATLSGPTASGVNNIAWNGQDSSGNQLPDGLYTMTVSATDSGGNALTPSNVNLIGLVTGVQTADSSGNDLLLGPNLIVNDANVEAVFSPASMQANNSADQTSS